MGLMDSGGNNKRTLVLLWGERNWRWDSFQRTGVVKKIRVSELPSTCGPVLSPVQYDASAMLVESLHSEYGVCRNNACAGVASVFMTF